jgi:hypothetical protein
MGTMNHNEATNLEAGVKYVLGELSQNQREEYEEHYFDCAECAIDVKALATFADTTREVLRQERQKEFAESLAPASRGWFAWLRPAFAVPAIVVLLAVVVYQNTAGFSGKNSDGAQVFNSYSLMGPSRGGDDGAPIQIHPREAFALDFDLTTTKTFDHYLCQLQDEAGNAVLQVKLAGEKANREVHLLVPGVLKHAGKYSVVVAGATAGNDSWSQATELSRMHFVVEFIQ